MGCNCCKEDDVRRDDPEIPNNRGRRPRRRSQVPAAQQIRTPVRAPQPQPTLCDICGSTLDPALYDSHRETCRANHRRQIRTAAQESAATAAAYMTPPARPAKEAQEPTPVGPNDRQETEDLSPEEACIICFENTKAYAFIPCGHLAVCKVCAPQLDTCPVCRGPREGLLFVERTSKLCVCKHCKHVIGPTFFDSHREVCALRMRQQAAAGHAPADAAVTADEARNCIECRTRPREHALLPCGHLLFCAQCAPNQKTCPRCCTTVTGSQPTYAS